MSNTSENVSEDTISTDEIKLILDQYRIGKKPLAKLLGWGETTIIRYMEGDVPTNEYSNKLRMILEDPEFYYDLLCKKKECLTGVAFKKSKKAVMTKVMSTKIYAVAFYIANKSNADICAGFIQYLLYYSQAFSLALFDRELFQEDCGVNTERKPYLKLYEGMIRCGVHTFEGVEEYLTSEDKELIECVMDSFLWYGPKALDTMMTFEKSMMKISRDKFNYKIISKDNMKNYFKDMLNQYQVKDLKSLHNYPDQRYMEIKEILK